MMFRLLRKRAYQRAYVYAAECQMSYFKEYMSKYIKKHIKYRSNNVVEHMELIELNETHSEPFTMCKGLLNNNQIQTIEFLSRVNQMLYTLMRTEYIVEFYLHQNEELVANECVNILLKENCFSNNNDYTYNVLYDIVKFSFQLRKGFVKSDAVAKAKVQEHWISRLPIFVFCATGLLVMKVLDMVVHYEDRYTYLKMLILVLVYFVSITMVYLRVYQTIMSETKKTASEIYSEAKRLLYRQLIEQAPDKATTLLRTSEKVFSLLLLRNTLHHELSDDTSV
jgi:uncharacterized protein (UPF0333 family)